MNIIDKQTFEDMMGDIDRQLENEGDPAHSRSIMASIKLKVAIGVRPTQLTERNLFEPSVQRN